MFRLFVATFFFASASCCIPIIIPPVNLSLDLCKGALVPTISVSPVSLARCVAEQPGVVALLLSAMTSGGDPVAYLLANGQVTAAKALRTCMSKELGLVNTDGSFNMAKLKALLKGKVTGTVYATNTQLGLDKCPPVVDYNVQDYLLCVFSYCWTGVGPIITG